MTVIQHWMSDEIKLTNQRDFILENVRKSNTHPTVDDIFNHPRDHSLAVGKALKDFEVPSSTTDFYGRCEKCKEEIE